jgi:hypothetical protein
VKYKSKRRINPKLIRYVERSERRKFRKIPYLLTSNRIHGGCNIVVADDVGKKCVKVHDAHVTLSKRSSKTPWGKVLLVHELRENLRDQHTNQGERKVHKHALSWLGRDIHWLHKHGMVPYKRESEFGPIRH